MRPVPSGGRKPKHHPIEYQGEGIVEAFPEVTDVSCDIDDNEVDGCVVRTGDGELLEVNVDEVQMNRGTEFSSAPHMSGTYEGTQYQMDHGPDSDKEFTKDYNGVWFDLTGMGGDQQPDTCVVASNDWGNIMVCGGGRTPLASLDPDGTKIEDENPFQNPEDYQRR